MPLAAGNHRILTHDILDALVDPLATVNDKKNFLINDGLCTGKVELRHVYVLMSGDRVKIERLDSQRAMIEIIRNSIPPSVVNLDKAGHLSRCLKLINRVPVSGLWRQNSLIGLQELVTLVENNH